MGPHQKRLASDRHFPIQRCRQCILKIIRQIKRIRVLQSDDIRLLTSYLSHVRAVCFLPVTWRNKTNGVANNLLNFRYAEGRIGFMTGLKIEDLPVSSLIQTTRAKHLTAGIIANQKEFVRGWNDKGFTVCFLMR